jgi:hypothetical protein
LWSFATGSPRNVNTKSSGLRRLDSTTLAATELSTMTRSVPAWDDAPEPMPDWDLIGQPDPDVGSDQRMAW